MNTQDIRQDEIQVEVVETVETVETTLHIQTGVQAGGISDLWNTASDYATDKWNTVKSWW